MLVSELTKVIVRGTIIDYIESETMKDLTYEISKDKKVILLVPDGDLKINIYVER